MACIVLAIGLAIIGMMSGFMAIFFCALFLPGLIGGFLAGYIGKEKQVKLGTLVGLSPFWLTILYVISVFTIPSMGGGDQSGAPYLFALVPFNVLGGLIGGLISRVQVFSQPKNNVQ